MADDDIGASARDWLSVVRRARLGRTTKSVAWVLALRADSDGTRIFPGIARLSVECELSPKVVKESLRALREAGLIAVERAASGPGESTEYRLVLDDVLSHVDVPDPGVHDAAIRAVADSLRGKWTPKLRGTRDPAEAVDNPDLRGAAATAGPDASEAPAGYGEDEDQAPAGYGESDLRGTANPATFPIPPQEDHLPQPVDEDLCPTVTHVEPVDNVLPFRRRGAA